MRVHCYKHIHLKDGTEFDVEYDEDVPDRRGDRTDWISIMVVLSPVLFYILNYLFA